MRVKPRPWSTEDLDTLKVLSKEMTLPKIAEKLGRTLNETRHQLRKQGLNTTVPWQRKFEDLSLIKKYSDVHGVKKAAEHYGLTPHVVKNIRRRYVSRISDFIEEVSPESIAKLRGAAMRMAHAKGRGEYAQDFASFAVIQRLTHSGCNLEWAWPTFLKETFGNYKNPTGALEYNANNYAKPIMDDPFDEAGNPVGVQVADEKPPDQIILALRIVEEFQLEGMDRICFMLYFHCGYTYAEIGMICGYSAPWVQQHVVKITAQLRKHGITEEDLN